MQKTQIRSLGSEDLLEKGMATHSSTLAWRILWTEELAGYSPWDCKELDMTEQLTISLFISTATKLQWSKFYGSTQTYDSYFQTQYMVLGI